MHKCASTDCNNPSIGTTEVKLVSYPIGKIRITVCEKCFNLLQGVKFEEEDGVQHVN